MSHDIADVRRLGLAVFERRRDKMDKKLAKGLARMASSEDWTTFTSRVVSDAIRAGDLRAAELEQAVALSRAGLLDE